MEVPGCEGGQHGSVRHCGALDAALARSIIINVSALRVEEEASTLLLEYSHINRPASGRLLVGRAWNPEEEDFAPAVKSVRFSRAIPEWQVLSCSTQ